MKKEKSEKRPSPNASVAAQRAWALLTPAQKAALKKRYRQDPDHDGVPTGFDCRPLNPKKQESFLPEDQAYIKEHPIVPIKRKGNRERLLGEGTNGYVLGVANNSRVALKISKSDAWNSLKSEARFYKKHQMSKLPLMIPMKEVKTDKGEYAVLKPVIKPIAEPGYVKNKAAFTDQRLEELRQKIIKLSYKGYIFSDGLQLGIDKAGRLLQFDTGAMKRVQNTSGISSKPFEENNKEWRSLLRKLGKPVSKYGKIERTPSLDRYYQPKKQTKSSNNSSISDKSIKKYGKIWIDPKFHFHAKYEDIYKKVKEVLKQFPEIKEVCLSSFYPTNKLDKNTVAYVDATFEAPILAFNVHMMPTYDTIYHELWHIVQRDRKSTANKTHNFVEVEATLFGAARMKPKHVENNFMCYFNTVPKSKVIHYGKMALAAKKKGNKHYVSDTFAQTEADKNKELQINKSNIKRWKPILKKDLPVSEKYNIVKEHKNYTAGHTPSIINKELRANIRKSQQSKKNLFKSDKKNTGYMYKRSNLKTIPEWMKSSSHKSKQKPKSKKSRA